MKPGRNHPCPCGSGKKYKHCCLAAELRRAESSADVVWARVRRAIDGAPQRLRSFIAEVYGAEALLEGWEEFTLWKGHAFDPENPLFGLSLQWLCHSWEPDPDAEASAVDASLHGFTPTRLFLERRGARLDPLLVRYLEACLAAPFSFYEILRADPGHGFRARDVITGEECEVLERSASTGMQAGDILFGQLVPIDGIVLVEVCSPYALPPIDKIRVIELRDQIERNVALQPMDESLLSNWRVEIRELYLDLVERFVNPRPPVLHNTDGELVKLQRVIFAVDDAESALAALVKAVPGADDANVEKTPDGQLERAQFSWTKAGNRMHETWDNTVLGRVEITGTRLVAHVNSDERAEAFRELVERTLGGAARYSRSETVGPEEAAAQAAEADEATEVAAGSGGMEPRLEDLPEVREQLERMIAQHYDDWPMHALPALGGRRPIDVVAEGASGREKVEALVADMERHSSRTSMGTDAAALARLRERLGLAR